MSEYTPSIRSIAGLSPEMVSCVEMLRAYLRDYPSLNRLLDREETSDRMLLFAMKTALVKYNGTPPMSQLSLTDIFRLNHQDLLIKMAAINVMESLMLLQARNQLNYSTGGTTVGFNDKAILYMKIVEMLTAATSQDLLVRKIAVNILSILDGVGVHSEYALVHSSYVFW